MDVKSVTRFATCAFARVPHLLVSCDQLPLAMPMFDVPFMRTRNGTSFGIEQLSN